MLLWFISLLGGVLVSIGFRGTPFIDFLKAVDEVFKEKVVLVSKLVENSNWCAPSW